MILWAMTCLAADWAQVDDLAGALDDRWERARAEVQWRSPTVNEREALRAAARDLSTGACEDPDLVRISAALRPHDYLLTPLTDGQTLVVVLEEGAEHRGSGLLAVRCGPSSDLVWQAPHALYEAGTRQLATALFVEQGGRALQVSTSHRYRAVGEARNAPVHPGDVTREAGSPFHTAFLGLAEGDPSLRFVQFHGFGRSLPFDAIASHARTGPPAGAVADRLRPALGEVAAWGRDTDQLGATTNVQGQALTRWAAPRFLHLELTAALRDQLDRSPEGRAALAAAVLAPW